MNFENSDGSSPNPEATVVIAIGGVDRLLQFEIALASIRGQTNVALEIIVIEQSTEPLLFSRLPKDVLYFHQTLRDGGQFNKGKAINFGARQARGRDLFIYDADFVVSSDYVRQCCNVLQKVEAVRPGRFIFNLDPESTRSTIETRCLSSSMNCESIVQNTPIPLAVRRSTYWQVGGHDECFEGWGGEDVELLSRLRTRSISEGGWLPVIHLWHPAAPKKANGDRNRQLQERRLGINPEQRIRELTSQGPELNRDPNG